jgi:BirA family biotin operon repressor/biotin-[acetyl-CoA-carboxylase] ligase
VQALHWQIHEFVEIDSTNRWLAGARPERRGTVAWAWHQTAGRGRLGRQWESEPGSSLLLSVLLRPYLSPDERHLAVASVALAAREGLVRLCGVRPDVKSAELIFSSTTRSWVASVGDSPNEKGSDGLVIGIGINPHPFADRHERTNIRDLSGVTLDPPGRHRRLARGTRATSLIARRR